MRFATVRLRPGDGRTLLDHLAREERLLLSVCGGRARCGKCRVRIVSGAVTPLSDKERQLLSPEEIRVGFRLACSCSASLNCEVRTAKCEVNNPQSAVRGVATPSSWSTVIELAIPEWEVMSGAAPNAKCKMRSAVSGLAVDVGTTNVAIAGYDLEHGKLVRAGSFLNPQMSFGMDVISRISRSEALIQDDALVPAIRGLVASWGQRLSDIRRIVAVGNTTMCHFLLGQDAGPLGVSPYRSALPLREPLLEVVRGLGRRKVLVLPLIGSYLGADTTAAIVASGMLRQRGLSLLMDLGTNGEIVLGNDRQLIACSTAAGPALEGANLSCGVLARPGAITDYRRNVGHSCSWRTVGGRKPIGLCGSAVVKLLSELLKHGVIEPSGRIKGALRGNPKLETLNSKPELGLRTSDLGLPVSGGILLVSAKASGTGRDILLSQSDIRELQLAKAAIATGVRILFKELGAQARDVSQVYLTGLLGGKLDQGAAMRIGLLPELKHATLRQQPNLALAGAELALNEPDRLSEFTRAAERTREVVLGGHPAFNDVFVESLGLRPWE
jgi:uncharacterized 2Fe-2S/4Fe-4S cluster protein (DUF4445 family)